MAMPKLAAGQILYLSSPNESLQGTAILNNIFMKILPLQEWREENKIRGQSQKATVHVQIELFFMALILWSEKKYIY